MAALCSRCHRPNDRQPQRYCAQCHREERRKFRREHVSIPRDQFSLLLEALERSIRAELGIG